MQRARISLLGVVVGLTSACLPSRADWPKPITPPKTDKAPERVTSPKTDKAPETVKAPKSGDAPTPITVPGANALPSTIKTPDTGALPATVTAPSASAIAPTISETRRLALPGLVEKMNSGQLSPQKAWDEKLIEVDDLLWIFTSYIEPWGGFPGKKNVEVRRALAKLLVENGGEKLKDTAKLPPTVRLWLADYYESVGDEKCVALCESILGEIKTPVKGENALVFQAIERLGWHDGAKGDYEKRVQSWLRIMDYHADEGWWTADAFMAAARSYFRLGDWDKTKTYAQKALAWLSRGQTSEADAERIKGISQSLIEWADKWKSAPLLVESPQTHCVILPNKPTVAFTVFSGRQVTLNVKSDNRAVLISAVNVPPSEDVEDLFSRTKIVAQIKAPTLKFLNAKLTITAAEYSGFAIEIPLSLEVEGGIESNPSEVFFDTVRQGVSAKKSVKLSAAYPFRITRLTVDRDWLQAQVVEDQQTNQPDIVLEVMATAPVGFYQGHVEVVTDVPGAEVMKLPYALRVAKQE